MLRRLSKYVLYLLTLSACIWAHPVFGADQAGWKLLWDGRLSAARQSFKSDVTADPKDSAAWRGLGWSDYYVDDTRSALHDWNRAITLAPGDWTTPGIWSFMCSMAEQMRRYDEIDAAAKVLSSTPGVDPSVKASALLVLAHRLDRTSSLSAGSAARAKLGLVTSWSVVGPFDNVSRSGFNRIFAPEQRIDLKAHYDGINAIPTQWRECKLISRDGACTVSRFVGGNGPNVYYAVSAVNVPAPTDCRVRFDATGASKIYVDGKLVSADSVDRVSRPDAIAMFDVPVKLHEGWNTLLVKSTDEAESQAQFTLGLTDSAGEPIRLLGQGFEHADQSSIDPDVVDSQVRARTCVQQSTAAHAGDIESAVIDGIYLRENGDLEDSESALRKAIEADTKSAILHWELSETLAADAQMDDARAERDLARAQSNGIPEAELEYIENDKSSASTAERLKLMRSLYGRFPESYPVAVAYALELSGASMDDQAFKIMLRAYRDNGGARAVTDLKLFFGDGDREKEVDKLVATAYKADPTDVDLASQYAEDLDSKNDYAGAIAIYKRLERLSPEDVSVLMQIAAIEREEGNRKGALSLYLSAEAEHPQDSVTITTIADLYENLGRKTEAIACYRRAVELNPTDVDLRDKLQLLTGQKPVLDLVPELPTPKIGKAAPTTGTDVPSVVNIVDDKREVVYPDYTTRSEYHEVLRINDDAGAQKYQSFPLARDSAASSVTVEKARLYKADGKVEDHTDSTGSDGDDDSSSTSVSFPSLAPGDVIDVTYHVDDRATGALARQFWAEWYFGESGEQTQQCRFVLITPVGMAYKYVLHGGAPEPTDRTVGNWNIRTWSVSDGPFYKHEVMSVPHRDWGPWVDVSTVPSWGDIVKWYEDLSSVRCVADDDIRAKALELTKDAKTDDDKLKALIQYVSHDIQYQSTPFRLSAYIPTEGREVIRERYGDCKDKAALLTAMLSAVGISSHMVLLSPREYGITPYLPSPRFAHAIAVVDIDGGKMWVDGTADGLEFGNVPWPDQGVPALVIDPSTQDLTTIPVQKPSKDGMDADFIGQVAPDGSMKGSIKLSLQGNYAWALRALTRQVSADKQEELLRGFASEVGSLEYEHGSITGVDDREAPLSLNVFGHDKQFATTAGNFLIFALPWSGESKSDDALDELTKPGRRADVERQMYGVVHMHVELTLPDGYQPQDLPASVTKDSQWFKSRFTYSFKNGVLTADWVEQTPFDRIPVAEIAGYAAAQRAEDDEATRKLVFKKG